MSKDNQNLISVIIPVYNTENYIDRCLDLILNNTYHKLQIICINDGSTDNSFNILNKYRTRDSRIIVINKENGGVSSARNIGLDLADGEYISFIDSDDFILPNYYEYLMEIMTENDADIIDCLKGAEINIPKGKDYKTMTQFEIVKNKSMRSYAAGKIYKRSIIGSNRFVEGISLHEDCIFNMSIIKDSINNHYTLKGILVNFPMYLYTPRAESAMHQQNWHKTLPAIEYLRVISETDKNPEISNMFAIECVRKSLLAWYDLYLRGNTSERKTVSRQMRKISGKIIPTANYTWKEEIIYKVFAYFPQLYRQFRLMNDPTMRQYEESVRKEKRG